MPFSPRRNPFSLNPLVLPIFAATACLAVLPVQASSHREAPSITGIPKVDNTDLYAFNSYEEGRSDFVTIISNFMPFQEPYGGPNYFQMDTNALYDIHIDNDGDAVEDMTFQFRFSNEFKAIALPIGDQNVAIPLTQAGVVTVPNDPALNVNEKFTLDLIRGKRETSASQSVSRISDGATVFDKPVDNIGTKTIPNYDAYASQHIYDVNIPGCDTPARLFVGQRDDGFAINVGVIFDLVNAPVAVITDPTLINAGENDLDEKNITSLALEVAKSCLVADSGSDPVIGVWSTASVRQARLANKKPPSGYDTSFRYGGQSVQVSRVGMPLVNEVVIGLPDKDKFNGSEPADDGQFAAYVTNPTLPALLEIALALPGIAPTNLPRTDLVTAFLTGIPGVNQPQNVVPSEMMRLNTAIPAVPFDQQNRLGIVGNILAGGTDNAGYPNGRRPKDDVVDISLVAVMGGLCLANGDTNALGFGEACNPAAVPMGETAFNLHDAVDQAAETFLPGFPYLNTPLPGAM